MLFTNKYIKMCKEAEEIQKDWKPKVGDYCICSRGMIGILTSDKKQKVTYPDGNTGYAYVGVRLRDGASWSSRKPIWLPTQEQLQEILWQHLRKGWNVGDSCKFGVLLVAFNNYVDNFGVSVVNAFTSYQELWLDLVMGEKYNKIWWHGKGKWVKRRNKNA